MANQAYNGQPINIQFDYEGEGTMDSKLVQLSESAAKDPTTWLKNGIYRIGNGQPVFTQDGKAFIYVGRKGNATDIADNSKWVQLATLNNIPSSISNAAKFKGVVNSAPVNAEAGDMYIAGDDFGISLGEYISSDINVPYYEDYVEKDGETVKEFFEEIEKGDLIIYGDNGVWYVLQKNLTKGEFPVVNPATVGGQDPYGIIPMFDSATNGYVLTDSGLYYSKLLDIQSEFGGSASYTVPDNPAASSVANMIRMFRLNGNSFGGSSLSSIATAVENTFVSDVKALRAQNDTKPIEFILNITAGAANNFFGFVKSQPHIKAVYEVGGASGSGIHDVIHFKNYDLAGTLSTPCVEYTYDLDTKVLSYQKFIEVTVS